MKKKSFFTPRLVSLAPMAGVTDSAFRQLCMTQGASFCISEMVSAKALLMGDKNTASLMAFASSERPFGIQLFGQDPLVIGKAAFYAEKYFSPDFININMGCPAPKITAGGAGSALMTRPSLAAEIVYATASSITLPVTVKIRSGYCENTAHILAPLLEQAGAAAIIVHGRTREQMYRPAADMQIIRAVKMSVSIPVIGNGDISTGEQALHMMQSTGCDAVMLGRAALGNPFIFSAVNSALLGRPAPAPPTAAQKMNALRRQIELMLVYKSEYVTLREARKHAAWYVKGMKDAAALRVLAFKMETMADLDDFIFRVLQNNI